MFYGTVFYSTLLYLTLFAVFYIENNNVKVLDEGSVRYKKTILWFYWTYIVENVLNADP